LLGLWGVSIDILLRNIRRILTEFTIGGVTISISSLLFGIAVFIVSAMLIKAIQKYLLNTALTSMEMEEGLKTSVISGFGFFGYIAAGIFAIGVMGGSLKNLAIIAGALSFGVGLGLQGIVNNFVSGLVLVFERPIKVGDWVIINGQEGIVKKINLRATELEMWTKASVIIPNSQILSSSLINMTHNNRQGRVDVKVGVAYGTDIQKVKTILLEIAKNHTLVLNVPNPYVVFNEFGDSSLDFELRCYTSNIGNRLSITNDLRAAILQRFTEESIEIPFPQRVVHTQSQNTIFLDKMVEGSAGTNKKAKLFAKKNAQKKKR
jgi:small-conductance mechanosensitive channel